nr:PREDICTED: transmembrane protein FLJ37396 isoform X2 [Rhinolophus sinicus]
MDEVYKVASTERIQMLEKELAEQLTELKFEIEERGTLLGTAHRTYSSVRIPKDISYYRRERELALKKTLQVAESKPLVIQADVMQRELESCLRREYTPENLPLLLLQYYTERITQLALSKYLHMLRWKRFCQHSKIMEQLYPLYKKQVAYIMQEYSDALQRAERLSVAQENFLMGKNNPPNLVTQEDLTIYTKWFVCHLHSLRTIHHYLQALQYLPISNMLSAAVNEVPEVGQENEKAHVSDISPDPQGFASPGPVNTSISGPMRTEAAFVLPQHTTATEELKPQLRLLLSHFNIQYDVEELRDAAKEIELFSMVSQKFHSIFMEQQRMQTFPDYDTGKAEVENFDLPRPGMALKKRADWISFIKIKPKCDPWQKKLLSKLKERRRIDVLMQLQAKFLKISNPERVMQVLQDHAAKTITLAPSLPTSVASPGLLQCNYDQIWENIYSNINLYQNENMKEDDLSMERNENDLAQISLSQRAKALIKQKKETGDSYAMALQLLGLDDGPGPSDRDPVLMRGAYLSFLYLRHLRIRELQRICLGILNYFRSVERTLTINTSGLTLVAGSLVPTIDDSSWVNTAKGGLGTLQGLGAHHYIHGSPAEHKVHSVQFLEFSEVENQDDYYSIRAGYIYTQDQQGVHVMYDEALRDLKELETELLLVASHYIEKEKGHKKGSKSNTGQDWGWAHAGVDRFAVLYDMWSWEAALLEDKRQLLDSYFEAYQHVLDSEERFALAQVMADIMHRCPRFDLSHPYFIKAYQDECTCLRLHLQLVRGIINQHIEHQREYVQRLWQEGRPEGSNNFGLPLNIICKQLISINNSCPALKNIYLLEFHPSLGLASLIPRALEHLFREARLTCRPTSASSLALLERRVLRLALDVWLTPAKPESWYCAQLQKDLFSAKVMGDPFLVEEIGLLAFKSAAAEGQIQGPEFHVLLLETFSKLLELVTLRHRLIEMSLESVHLARLYKEMAWEMGFEEFHLYLRPVHFEFASLKDKVDHSPPMFITSLLENSDHVDRYSPTTLVLAISELDDNQVGKFSFYTKEAILKLFFHSGVENMQVTLACQAAQKNALMVAVQQASFYHPPGEGCPDHVKEISSDLRNHGGMGPTRRSSRIMNGMENLPLAPTPEVPDTLTHPSERSQVTKRAPEAFVSIQLEKVGLRDVMLNAFLLRKQTMADRMKSLDEIGKIKRDVIVEYCQKFNHHMSHYSLRGQIMAYCNSLRALLEQFPTLRDTLFVMGQPQEKKGLRDSKESLKADPRSLQPQPRCLLSADGKIFLNLWFIPHPSEVLIMFKALPEKAAFRALKLTLQLIGPFHDIVACLFSFAKLGNWPACFEFPRSSNPVRGDWGGTEGIEGELQELQKMIDSLQSPQDPAQVSQVLLLRREVLFLQFDAAVRHLIRRTFLAAGNAPAYQSVTDGMYHGLPPLSNSLVKSIFASQLSLPQPLDPRSSQAFVLFPWRAFLEDGGPFPVTSSSPDTLEYNMQLCLCRLSDCDLRVAHGELVGMHLLMEDVLLSSYHMIMESPPVQQATLEKSTQPDLCRAPGVRSQFQSRPQASKLLGSPCDAAMSLALLRSFLVRWKQLEVLKEHWGRLKLKGQDSSSVSFHKQFSELYGTDILYPSMRAIARRMGKEDEFEELIISSQSILPPKGASEIEIKTQQLQKLLENLEIHMIQEVLRKVNREITLVMSEKSKEQCTLPTDLWKHQVMKENFSVVRPQIVENFIQRLMEKYQDGGLEITFRKDHLEACLLSLGCDVIARERSNFESYSMCYEHVLEHARQKLCQKEQELDILRRGRSPPEDHAGQVAELSHNMIMEITALRAQLTDLEEENLNLEKQIRKEVQEEYKALVQALFMTCVHMKEKLDENQLNLIQKLCELISEVRTEGIEHMKDLKKKWGSARPDEGMKENPTQQDLLRDLEQDNCSLSVLVCKVRSLGRWRLAVQQARFQGQLSRAEKEVVQSKKECLRIKLMAEQEAVLFRQQLLALRQALARAQADNVRICKQQDGQAQLLKELEHRLTQEALHWQQLDFLKTCSMEKLLEDVGQKEQQLQRITEEADRASKLSQLQRKKIQREVRQMRSRLAQERSVKLEAFQRVEELQNQLSDATGSSVQMSSACSLVSRVQYSLNSASTSSRYSQQHLLKTNLMDNKITRRIQRPKTVPIKHKKRTDDGFLPNVAENVQLSAFQVQTAPSRMPHKPDW